MNDYNVSDLKLFSLGIVVKNKLENESRIYVIPIESLPELDGELTKDIEVINETSENIIGSIETSQLFKGNHLIADWIPESSNRDTAPDVVQGETVKIYKYGDTDQYYWSILFREPGLRRLEHVRYIYSNQSKYRVPHDKDTSYWIEISTRDKYIKIHTSTNDKEPYGYDIELNTDVGLLTIKDTAENSIELNSEESSLTASINKTVNVNTEKVNIKATEVNVIAETTNISGNTNIGGDLKVSGSTSTGPVTVSGGVNASDNVNAPNI